MTICRCSESLTADGVTLAQKFFKGVLSEALARMRKAHLSEIRTV